VRNSKRIFGELEGGPIAMVQTLQASATLAPRLRASF